MFDDQLMMLGLNVDYFLFWGFVVEDVSYVRLLDVVLIQYGGLFEVVIVLGLLGLDCIFIYVISFIEMVVLLDVVWWIIVDVGCYVLFVFIIEMQMGYGYGILFFQ